MVDVSPGQLVAGKYRIERVLGEGGMGVVVEATHLQLEELVAIKFLREEPGRSAEVVQRFLREARASRMIKSERAVKVFDVGTTETGAPFIVMELLQGSDVAALLAQRGPMPVEWTADLLVQACEALAEAHAKGIVHRDLKPANLFVTTGGDGSTLVKVLDFGISKMGTGVDSNLTKTRGFMGTALYVSPEQLRSAKNVDARADLWALGVIMFEVLTGTHPFLAEDIAQLSVKIVMDAPTSLRSLRPDVPDALDRIVARCLEKASADRFGSCAELAMALRPFASPAGQALADALGRRAPGVPATAILVAPPVSQHPGHETSAAGSLVRTTDEITPTSSRRPVIAVAMVVLVLAGIGGAIVATRSSAPADEPTASAKPPEKAAPSVEQPAPAGKGASTETAPSKASAAPAASAPSVASAKPSSASPAPPKIKSAPPPPTKKPKTDDIDI